MTHPLERKIIDSLLARMNQGHSDEYDIVSKAAAAFRHIYATKFTELEIENGGFVQYFENSIGQLGMEALEAYRAMGAKECAKVLNQAITVFKRKFPKQTLYPHKGRWEWGRPFSPDPDLEHLTDRFYDAMRKDNPEDVRAAFIAANVKKYQVL
jgi:hypothetical protein